MSTSPYYGGGGGYGGATLTTSPGGGAYYGGGASGMTSANAGYRMTIEQAKALRNQNIQAAIETRKKLADEARAERANFNPEKTREQENQAALERARKDPPLTEIWSGTALNSLFNYLGDNQTKLRQGPSVPLDEDTLKQINLTSRNSRANPGLLKNGGHLQWPVALQDDDFKAARERLDDLLPKAAAQAQAGNAVNPGNLQDLRNALNQLRTTLADRVNVMLPSDHIAAQRYLNQIDDALRALSDPAARTYFQTPPAKNVAELARYMIDKGLLFAPAVPGQENAYIALYRAMQSFDEGLRGGGAAAAQAPKNP